MRLTQYITEEKDVIENLTNTISKECKPFLKEFGISYKHDRCIWRGAKSNYKDIVTRVKTRKDRLPRYNKRTHEYLSKISKEIFGWNIRSEGIFTGSVSISKGYGKKFVFIPIGKYRYVWVDLNESNIYRLYDRYELTLQGAENIEYERHGMDKKDFEKYKKDQLEEINVDVEDIKNKIYDEYKNKYKTSGLNLDSSHSFEAIFDCKEYLLINADSYHVIKLAMSEL